MLKRRSFCWIVIIFIFFIAARASAQQAGFIRGMIYDKDFDAPLPAAEVSISETGEKSTGSNEGNFVFDQVAPGNYTLIFSKEGYTRHVEPNVVVSPGQMTEVNVTLSGAFVEMEEFFVQDLIIGGGTEAGLLRLRIESPALLDSISADLMSQAGAGDAASALKLVAGATVQDGKFAVIRGLPDRYVNSQMNTVRLPTADADKRAVQLDQFPSGVIESVQVSKTFTPDQQGDASGGAVNVVLKGIPDKKVLKVKAGTSFNSQLTGSDFLTYEGRGVNFLGIDNGSRDIPSDGNFEGPVGVMREDPPFNYNTSLTAGGKREFNNGITVGGFASLYYKKDSDYYEEGINDAYWVENPGDPLTPRKEQVSSSDDFKTSLFDVTQGTEERQWGGLGALGIEIDNHILSFIYLYTRVAEDRSTLFEDTRGKEYYFPGYDRDDPNDPGNQSLDAAPYIRTQTLKYSERTTQTLQLKGQHTLPFPDLEIDNFFGILPPEIGWTLARSFSGLDQPDKRQFGATWWGPMYIAAIPPWFPETTTDPLYRPFKPAATFTLGNLQRTWVKITEDSDQYFVDGKFPFEQWSGDEGYVKVGVFKDKVKRKYNQDSFSNFNDNAAHYYAPWDQFWSDVFPEEVHPVTAADIDVDYRGEQKISAWYYMADLPLWSFINIIGGVRYERTKLSIVNEAEEDVTWVPPGTSSSTQLNPGDADVSFSQEDALPSIGFVFSPIPQISLRGSRSRTVARQTFKELTPIQQQEFLGADVFIGNPALKMSALKNYDLRLDYKPYEGGLISYSWFHKEIRDPIEYVQKRTTDFGFTTPVNYPEGTLDGFEIEVRQDLGHFWDVLDGFSLGGNATFIDSEVILPEDEILGFQQTNIMVPITSRDMANAPEHLYNVFMTYDWKRFGTQFGIFYTVRGDTLVAGAGQANGNFIPSVYETEYATLNFSVSQKIFQDGKLVFQAKNLLNPKIQEVYRSAVIDGDTVKTSYTKGIDFSLSLTWDF